MQYAVAGTKFEHTSPRPRLRVAACCLLPAACRSGISLMEVLVSIGIVALGLVSIASLIPVGGLQAQKADQIQRQSDVGLETLREFTTRGFSIVDPADRCPWVHWDSSTSKWVSCYDSTGPAWKIFLPVAFDPLMIGKTTTPADSNKVFTFPANAVAGAPAIERLTLAQAATGSATAYTPSFPLADAILRSTDDLIVDQPSDTSLPGTSSYLNDTSATPKPLKRASGGLYSWIATLAPYNPNEILPATGTECTLSVVVFYRRNLSAVPDPGSSQEEMVQVATGFSGIGGGDMEFDLTATQKTQVGKGSYNNPLSLAKAGNWLMLCRYEPWQDSSGAWQPKRVCKWYRVVASEGIDPASSIDKANVTLSGPDWPQPPAVPPGMNWGPVPSAAQNFNTYACLFDSAVAVYQKVIRLEGSSQWSQ
jgi:hypothetical protein